MKTLLKTIDNISARAGILAAWLAVPLILATCYEVFARYALGAPTSWAFELGYMLTGIFFMLGCAYTLREGAHIRIDVIYNRFPPKARAALTALFYLFLFLPAAMWITYGLWQYGVEAYRSGEHSGQSAWNPVIWPFRFILCAGFALLTLQAIAETLKALYFLFTGSDLARPQDRAAMDG